MKKKRKKKRQVYYLQLALIILFIIIICGAVTFFYVKENTREKILTEPVSLTGAVLPSRTEKSYIEEATEEFTEEIPAAADILSPYPLKTDNSQQTDSGYDVRYALLMNADRNEIVAYNNENTPMFPASLTKIMTLIVAVENIEKMSDTVKITEDMVYPMVEQEAVVAGFQPDETPTVEDLLYGMVLCSGAEASLAIAEYVAGSEEAFVQLMNDKAAEMGLEKTHFTNVVGLHNRAHYSTAADMALILKYAIQNETCRKIISAYEYKVPPTEQNPDGLTFTSNFFSRMYGDEVSGVKILGGKTGFTDEAGNCIESFAEINGETYILVLCRCRDKWTAVYDTLNAYSVYGAGGEKYYTYEEETTATVETEQE